MKKKEYMKAHTGIGNSNQMLMHFISWVDKRPLITLLLFVCWAVWDTGKVEWQAEEHCISGWAQDQANAEAPYPQAGIGMRIPFISSTITMYVIHQSLHLLPSLSPIYLTTSVYRGRGVTISGFVWMGAKQKEDIGIGIRECRWVPLKRGVWVPFHPLQWQWSLSTPPSPTSSPNLLLLTPASFAFRYQFPLFFFFFFFLFFLISNYEAITAPRDPHQLAFPFLI